MRSDRRDNIDHYRNLTACLTCAPQASMHALDKVKRLKRWEHESDARQDASQARPHAGGHDNPPADRRASVSAPLKAWMGSTHFLTRTLEKVKTEPVRPFAAFKISGVTGREAQESGLPPKMSVAPHAANRPPRCFYPREGKKVRNIPDYLKWKEPGSRKLKSESQ